jgi:hypothetical protein
MHGRNSQGQNSELLPAKLGLPKFLNIFLTASLPLPVSERAVLLSIYYALHLSGQLDRMFQVSS